MRIALMGIVHESNGFVQTKTLLDDFRAGHWFCGEDILTEYRNAHHELGGMIEVMETAGVELVPLMYAEATPGGPLSRETYEALLTDLLCRLAQAMPLDACLVTPHGAGEAEGYPDMDGHWLSSVRKKTGTDIPVVGTIDPHANVSAEMMAATDALVAYKTNPHIDQRATGREAAILLLKHLRGEIKLSRQFRQLPLAISIEQQYTGNEPCRSLFEKALSAVGGNKILSVSVVLGFPYADVKDMGSAIIVISDNDAEAETAVLDDLQDYICKRLTDFNGNKKGIAGWINELPALPSPVLLLDMGDNIGGGAPGNSVHILEALENADLKNACCYIHDSSAVEQLNKAMTGNTYTVDFGQDPATGASMRSRLTVLFCGDGRFEEAHARHGGQTHFDMGNIVLAETDKGNTVLLSSKRVPPFSLVQWTHAGVNPEKFNYIIAKGVNAPIAAYAPICKTIVQVDSPGVTQADMTRFYYANRRRPLFPFEML